MKFIETIKNRVKQDKKVIILPEATDVRVLEAAATVTRENFATIVLIGNKEEIKEIARQKHLDIENIQIIDPLNYDKMEQLIMEFYELRKHKGITKEKARAILVKNPLYFANMLVKLGFADGIVSGATHSTADTLRPALQILSVASDAKIASSFFLMDVPNCTYGEQGLFIYSDCGMIQNPTSEELVEIAVSSAKTFSLLIEKEPKIAFLSHSTFGTSKCSDVDKVSRAVDMAKKRYPDLCLDGEMQLDTAIVPEVAKRKAAQSQVAGHANVLIFPDLDAGNIGYKLTERLAKAKAYGPIMQGLAKPVNDLSRGCSAEDIVGVIAITALQAMCSLKDEK